MEGRAIADEPQLRPGKRACVQRGSNGGLIESRKRGYDHPRKQTYWNG